MPAHFNRHKYWEYWIIIIIHSIRLYLNTNIYVIRELPVDPKWHFHNSLVYFILNCCVQIQWDLIFFFFRICIWSFNHISALRYRRLWMKKKIYLRFIFMNSSKCKISYDLWIIISLSFIDLATNFFFFFIFLLKVSQQRRWVRFIEFFSSRT